MLGVVAAFAAASGSARAAGGGGGGGGSGGCFFMAAHESAQPHPQFSAAERSTGDPVTWLQHLFGGGQAPPAGRTGPATAGAAAPR